MSARKEVKGQPSEGNGVNEAGLCFENNCQTEKFEETTLFAAGRRIYVWIRRGPQLKEKKTAKKEKKREDEKGAEAPFH